MQQITQSLELISQMESTVNSCSHEKYKVVSALGMKWLMYCKKLALPHEETRPDVNCWMQVCMSLLWIGHTLTKTVKLPFWLLHCTRFSLWNCYVVLMACTVLHTIPLWNIILPLRHSLCIHTSGVHGCWRDTDKTKKCRITVASLRHVIRLFQNTVTSQVAWSKAGE